MGTFREPSVYQESADGYAYVFDRRGHAVYGIAPGSDSAEHLVQIGPEEGRIIAASTFDLGGGSRFVVADGPDGRERVQLFEGDGTRVGSFRIPGRAAPRLTLGDWVLNGIGSLEFTGRAILINQAEAGGLITLYTLNGYPYRTIGSFRATGHESERDLHLALNSGLPLADPETGGYYFVFQGGPPAFRKYDRDGALLYERAVQGPEVDPIVNNLPVVWPERTDERGRTLPMVPPNVRTAALDRRGNLWIALSVPYVYVYNPAGEKIRTVQLEAAGPVLPSSLYFPDETRMLVAPGCYEFTVW